MFKEQSNILCNTSAANEPNTLQTQWCAQLVKKNPTCGHIYYTFVFYSIYFILSILMESFNKII